MTTPTHLTPKKLKGFRDYLPSQAHLRKQIQDKIFAYAIQSGFLPIDTPTLEHAETLLGSSGQETEKEVYKFVDNGERPVALRFDLTVPFARFVAENFSDLTFPFKKIQIGNVWRGEKPQKGRYREFCQADFDIIGVDSISADTEIISCITHSLTTLIAIPFTVAIGHRVILSAIIKACLPNVTADNEVKVLIALDKLEKIGNIATKNLLLEIEGATDSQATLLLQILQKKDENNNSCLTTIKHQLQQNEAALTELARLEKTVELLKILSQNTLAKIQINLSIARGLGYYTGIVFESTIDSLTGFGSVASGGRYNTLVSRFSTQELPGIGGSIGVDRLFAAMEELSLIKEQERHGVFIAVAGDDSRTYAFTLLQMLRNKGINTDISLKEGKLGNQFKFADKRKYAIVITIGSNEVSTNCVSIKKLDTGEEHRDIPLANVISYLI